MGLRVNVLTLVQRLRRELMDSGLEERAKELQASTYWHPNGFMKIPILRCPDGSCFRIHYWPPETTRLHQREDIHTHRWSYCALVLSGRLRMHLYERAAVGEGSDIDEFWCPANIAGQYALQTRGHVALKSKGLFDITVGRPHLGDSQVIHRVAPIGADPVVTAFLQGNAERSISEVFLPLNASERQSALPDAVTADAIIRALQFVKHWSDANNA